MPYTTEFDRLKAEFWKRSFRKTSDAEFWSAILTVAKKGGIRGKPKSPAPPALTDEQRAVLGRLLPLPIGERDRLPYTDRFDHLVNGFNIATQLDLTPHELWLAVLQLAK